MAEWSNAIDSKSIVPISGTQGSNPCLTANKQKTPSREFFVYSDIYKPAHKKNRLLIIATGTNSQKLG